MATTTDQFRALGPSGDLPDNWVNPYYLEDRKLRVGVARVGDQLFAFDDLYQSTNGPCPLSAGLLTGTVIMSQCDGSKFDLTTGAVLDGPAIAALTTYEVHEADGQIRVKV
jgi:3-phenylpropionate/trans-cinnamate dioxygenase ferredoxin component